MSCESPSGAFEIGQCGVCPEWKTFGNIAKFYDRFSHASFFSVASQTMFSQPGMLIVLGEFDPEEKEPYRLEMRRRMTAATVVGHLIDYLSERLPKKGVSDIQPT